MASILLLIFLDFQKTNTAIASSNKMPTDAQDGTAADVPLEVNVSYVTNMLMKPNECYGIKTMKSTAPYMETTQMVYMLIFR